MLLNDTLTNKPGKPGSHFDMGWSRFIDEVVRKISDLNENIVFLLCGKRACIKKTHVDLDKHHVIETVHPSHYKAKQFINANNFLKKKSLKEIQW